MPRSLTIIITALILAQAAIAQPPPTGDERVAMIAGIRASYPAMPDALVEVMADSRRQISDQSPCALIDWMLAPGSGAPEPALEMMRSLSVCVLGVDDLDAETVDARLGEESFRFDVEGDVVTMLARSAEEEVYVCCSLQVEMTRVGDNGLWAARRRLGGIEAAVLSLSSDFGDMDGFRRWRGPEAPPAPDEVELGKWAGQIIERELASASLGETRRLSIYLPPDYSKDRVWPALFLADGGAPAFAGLVEKMVAAGEIRPMIIISAHSGEGGVVGEAPTHYGSDLRSAEYLRGFPGSGDRFDRHMEFFAGELVDFAVADFNVSVRREDRAVGGSSNGGVLALWAGVLHPETFATAIPMSAGYVTLKPEDLGEGLRAVFHLSAGRYETPFIRTTKRTEAMLRDAGFEVSGSYFAAGHFQDMWVLALRDALLRAFPAQ